MDNNLERVLQKAKCVQFGDLQMPLDHVFENVQQAVNYAPQPDDVFVVSYPRSGDFWVQRILWLLLHDGYMPPEAAQDAQGLTRFSPTLELGGTKHLHQLPRPALIKSHLPFEICPFAEHTRYIYVARNAKDVCTNFYYDQCLLPQYDFEGDFDEFYACFVHGRLAYGDYFDHVLGWFEQRHLPNVLFVLYEDLIHDPITQLLRLAAFLGDDYEQRLQERPDMLEDVLEYSALPFMGELGAFDLADVESRLEYLAQNGKEHFFNGPTSSVIGNHRFMLSGEQEDLLKEILITKNKDNDLPYLWCNYGIF